jgi:DNA-binding XRE family transcriptional regulator
MSNNTVAQVIRHARFLLNLTQEEAGQLVGVTRRAWEHWENETREMSKAAFELFIAKISGQVRSHLTHSDDQQLVVVTADDGVTPIDVVSSQNFLSLRQDKVTETLIINSLAIDRFSGKSYKHQVRFSTRGNEHVISAARKWQQSLNSAIA